MQEESAIVKPETKVKEIKFIKMIKAFVEVNSTMQDQVDG